MVVTGIGVPSASSHRVWSWRPWAAVVASVWMLTSGTPIPAPFPVAAATTARAFNRVNGIFAFAGSWRSAARTASITDHHCESVCGSSFTRVHFIPVSVSVHRDTSDRSRWRSASSTSLFGR